MFLEIMQGFGRELSPLTIYQAPTIAALADVLEEPELPRFPTLFKIKAGTELPPIFMSTGMGGTVMEFFQLVRQIETNHPIYGLQLKGMDGVQEPCRRIEELAQFNLDAVRAMQPHGPYILIGYSLGGLVALEMAQRLSKEGEKIALLVMVETYPHWSRLSFGHRAAVAKHRVTRLITRIFRRAGLRSSTPDNEGWEMLDAPKVGEKFRAVMRRVRDDAYQMFERYRPHYYKGKIHFVRATEIEPIYPDDPNAAWAKFAENLVVETAPGNHFNMFANHSKDLAAILSRCLKEVDD
jgi:thioesterase domain-containing protein